MKFTIRRNGNILGTYSGEDEGEALDSLAKEEGCKDFKESCTKLKLTRDNYTVTRVEEV